MNAHLMCDVVTHSSMTRECNKTSYLSCQVSSGLSLKMSSNVLLMELQVLELSGNNIISIMSLRLSSFPMLKHLSLQDNKITKVRTHLSKAINAFSVTCLFLLNTHLVQGLPLKYNFQPI